MGRCFKFRFEGGDEYDAYIRITAVDSNPDYEDSDYGWRCVWFNAYDSGDVFIGLDNFIGGNVNDYIPITEKQYYAAWARIQKKISKLKV